MAGEVTMARLSIRVTVAGAFTSSCSTLRRRDHDLLFVLRRLLLLVAIGLVARLGGLTRIG